MTTLSQHEKNFENNPKKTIKKAVFWVLGLVILFGVISYGLGWFSEAGQVAKKEFGAKASLKKYEWFKDASAQIEQKKQSILVYETNVNSMLESYGDEPRKNWDRTDKEQYNQWNMEVAGLKVSYNILVAEYNAASSKFNWKIYKTETDLPQSEFTKYLAN